MKKKVTIIGHFGGSGEVADGQCVKTRIFSQELDKILSADNVGKIDTHDWKKNPFKLFLKSIVAVQQSDNVIFMTDEGGIKVFPWLLQLANPTKRCKIHYLVVGGWLLHFPEKHKFLTTCLKRLNGIYVETNAMKSGLEGQGFSNLYLMPNCKNIPVLDENEMVYSSEEPFKLCTFSRVMREKGIEEAIEAVVAVNATFGREIFTLDIYGQVDSTQKQWFETLSASLPKEVKYCGIVPYDQSVEVLKKYHALLFPTKFFTEGIPGTIIDAYAAGVPVIATEWESISDIVTSGVTGISYPFNDFAALKNALMDIAKNPMLIHNMKKNCLHKAKEYLPENVMNIIVERLS